MNLDQYQELASKFNNDTKIGDDLLPYLALGLCGESGEIAEKLKKIYRDQGGVMSSEDRVGLAYELGDLLWYISQIAKVMDFSLDVVAIANLNKLEDRQKRNVISGSGDNR